MALSIVTLFTSKSPTLAGGQVEFDAVLEDTFTSTVEIASYPVEFGARAADHRILQPVTWKLTGVISNNPLRIQATDFTGLLNDLGGGIGAQVAGLSAGFLSGSDDTRASSAIKFLFVLQTTGEPFDIDAGDFTLQNMVITELNRVKDPSNEGGLIFEATLTEFASIETLLSEDRQPMQDDLRDGDPAKDQAAGDINKGEVGLMDSIGAGAKSLNDSVRSLF